ncbi:MAG: 16S rRNA (adenine(1518)-N(6)/adenine(1519)-N(6))-dimethyltransferase RsmA [Christensenellales bacterium]|jgi:16S rRNA (adenine1518-N6/adenine1519-N6)-dimethyltransferase
MNDGLIGKLREKGFHFKKGLGQNFITDKNLLAAIVRDSGISREDTVAEIGSGAGTLTMELAAAAKQVHTFEVDPGLKPVLEEMFSGINNISLHFADVLKLTDKEIKSIINGDFAVVANIPYYITTNLIMRFIESGLPVTSLTLTVQKEVAKRICAREGNPDYGALTLACALWGDASITRIVKKEVFYPVPKVDSAVVKIIRNPKFGSPEEHKRVTKIIKSAFHMRRKTLINNLSADFCLPKELLADILAGCGMAEKTRGEDLPLSAYLALARDSRLGNIS